MPRRGGPAEWKPILGDACNGPVHPAPFSLDFSSIFLFLFHWCIARISSRLRILLCVPRTWAARQSRRSSPPKPDTVAVQAYKVPCMLSGATHAWWSLVLPVYKNLISTLRPGNITDRTPVDDTVPSSFPSNLRPIHTVRHSTARDEDHKGSIFSSCTVLVSAVWRAPPGGASAASGRNKQPYRVYGSQALVLLAPR